MSLDDEPERDRRRRPRGDRPGTVRLQVASRLPWLGCYPVAAAGGTVELRHPLTGASHALDRRGLAGATRAIKQLVRDHAVALTELVGDVASWQGAALALLEGLKPTIHDEVALPTAWSPALHPAASCRRAARLTASAPALASVVEALGWCHAAEPERLTAALTWLERHRDQLTRLSAVLTAPADKAGAEGDAKAQAKAVAKALSLAGLPEGPASLDTPVATMLLLRHLADQDGDRLVDPLLAALAEPWLHEVSTRAGAYVRALGEQITRDSRTAPTRPPTTPLGPGLRALLPWLATAPTASRRLGLRAIAAARLPAFAAVWHDVWRRLDAIAAPMGRPRPPTWEQLVALHREVAAVSRSLPADLELTWLLRTLQAPMATMLELLEELPALDEPGAAAELVVALHQLAAPEPEPGALPAMLRACLADQPARWPILWQRVLQPGLRRRAVAVPETVAQARVVGAALGVVLVEAEVATVRELVMISRYRPEVATAVAHWRVWRARASLTADEVELALTVTATADELRDLTTAIGGTLGEEVVSELRPVAAAIGPAGAAIVRGLLVAGEHARIVSGSRTLAIARALDLAVPALLPATTTGGGLPAELTRYPVVLHPALARLATAAPGLAAGILDDTFPDPRATARELAAIEARLAANTGDARLGKRADNLRARLVAPPAVSAVRVERLRAKLERAADVASFDRWLEAVRRACAPRLLDALGLAPEARPPWLDEPAYQRTFAGIVRLPAAPRALARRVLAHRLGPPPWDLRDEPYNHAWLARLTARGVDPTAWLAGLGARRHGAGAAAVTLSLEDDPLEVLRMGEHFSTCLAPGSFNFFAAVVNAAEINKRVIYGRDPEGRVLGRCLIGLTDAGGLVTFQPYFHGRGDFAAMVRGYVLELAGRLGTVVVPSGRITPLAGCDWYDDGPRDLTGAFGFLADDAPFRRELATVPVGQLLAELARRFAPLPVGGLTLSLIVPLPELDARPELIVPCLPLLDASADVPLELRLRAARLAERAGQGELLGERFVAHLAPTTSWWYSNLDVLELAAPRAPSRLLAWLRAAKVDVTVHDRPAWDYGTGLALEALHRPAQAGAAYRAAARGRHKDIANRARIRLRGLALDAG